MKHTDRIIMISDMHNPQDDRIYWKEAVSLSKLGYSVTHICAGEKDNDYVSPENIRIISIYKPTYSKVAFLNKLIKVLIGDVFLRKVEKLINTEEVVYIHLHDINLLKLIPAIQKLKQIPVIIFDAHDPFYRNAIDYNDGNLYKSILGNIKSLLIRRIENKYLKHIDCVITTEEILEQRYKKMGVKRTEIIYNYTDLNPAQQNPDFSERDIDVIYSGLISEKRGVFEMIESIHSASKLLPDIKAVFIGKIHSEKLKNRILKKINDLSLENNISIYDFVPYKDISKYYLRSKIGLGIFQPIPTHKIILQIKIFEYMAFGITIIGSDFGHIKEYIQKDNVGFTTNCFDSQKTGDLIVRTLREKELFKIFNQNGINAVRNHYNWKIMENKLESLYKSLSKCLEK